MDEKAKEWYQKRFVQYEIVKALKHREMAFLNVEGDKCVRDLSGWNVEYLNWTFQSFSFYDTDYRIYRSVGQLEKTPIVSWDPGQRANDKIDVKERWKDVQNYDLVLDLDGKSIQESKKDALAVCELYDEMNLPYWVQFSGNKGFHIIIEDRWTPPMKDKNMACAKAANMVYELTGAESIDPAIYDKRRILKAPYTLDFKSGQNLVVLPLTDDQLKKFKVEDAKIDTVMTNLKLYSRGILERQGSEAAARKLIQPVSGEKEAKKVMAKTMDVARSEEEAREMR